MDNVIQIGKNFYTPSQIKAMDELFGEGFLQANPHFPNGGPYKYPNYHFYSSRPLLLQERGRQAASQAAQQLVYANEQIAERDTILEACAEMGNSMHISKEQIIARIKGVSKNDCREKFVRKHLKFTGEQWREKYDEWLGNWHYERFITDVIE